MYVNEVLSAWTEVSIATWPSTERFRLPGVAIWTDFDDLSLSIQDASELIEMAIEEQDNDSMEEISIDVANNENSLYQLEFRRMFSNKMDPNNAYLDIQSGSGGTEAQDWAEMLMRMYLKWGESKGFETEVIEPQNPKTPKTW